MTDWDRRFLNLAHFISGWSKDPSTKVGAVIIDQDRCIVSMGYNGFPRKVIDLEERYNDRDLKYKMVVHAERNAILTAQGKSLRNTTIYTWPFMPCSVCTGMIIQCGISKVVAPPASDEILDRWKDDIILSETMLNEAGVTLFIKR